MVELMTHLSSTSTSGKKKCLSLSSSRLETDLAIMAALVHTYIHTYNIRTAHTYNTVQYILPYVHTAHIYIYMYIRTDIHSTYIHISISPSLYIHTYIHTYNPYRYLHAFIHNTHIHTYIHLFLPIHTYIHTYIQTYTLVAVSAEDFGLAQFLLPVFPGVLGRQPGHEGQGPAVHLRATIQRTQLQLGSMQ